MPSEKCIPLVSLNFIGRATVGAIKPIASILGKKRFVD